MKINELFTIDVAKSHSTDDYDIGNIPFITNSEINNGVVRYVDPFVDDKVFQKFTICISGLGFATLQINDYLPKGNGGDSATILISKKEMPIKELLFYTAQFNICHKWRFSFGRKCSKRRIEKLSFTRIYNKNDKCDVMLDQIKNKLLKKIISIKFEA